MKLGDRILATTAYLFGIPALYIILTDKRNKEYIGYHGAQAMMLWIMYSIIFFALRFLINMVWSSRYMPSLNILENLAVVVMAGYAVFCGYRALRGKKFSIPH